MKHYGDITKLSGYELPVVDVITGGSPCQDLSVAGKRAGLDGERSGLFMDQIRIVKEMRQADVLRGRSGQFVRPRYMVWENVPGAFSSGKPKGADFAAVIEEIIKVCEPDADLHVCVPDEGWTKSGCYYAEDGSWSIAWRLHDAQFWGVPQRRKRIALVADFGGLSAPEVLFERKGLSRDSEPGGTAREEAAGAAASGAGITGQLNDWCAAVNESANHQQDLIQHDQGIARTIAPGTHASGSHLTKTLITGGVERASVKILNPSDSQENQIADSDGIYPTLRACGGAGYQQGYCLDKGGVESASGTISFQERAGKPGGGKGILIQNERTGALSTSNNQSVLDGRVRWGKDKTIQCEFCGEIFSSTDSINGLSPAECPKCGEEYRLRIVGGGVESAEPAGFCRGQSARTRGIGYQIEQSPTIPSGDVPLVMESAGAVRGGIENASVGVDVYNQEITGDVAASLTAAVGGTNTSGAKVLCLNDQGGNVNCEEPIPIHDQATRFKGKHGEKSDGKGNGFGVGRPGDPANTLSSADRHAVCYDARCNGDNDGTALVYENHAQDSRYKPLGDVCETVNAKYGTVGNNQPLVVSDVLPFDTTQVTSDKNWSNPQYGDPCHPPAAGAYAPAIVSTYQDVTGALTPGAHPGSYNGQDAYNDMLIAHTLNAKANCQFREDDETYVAAVDCRNGLENPNTNGTLQAKSTGGIGVNFQNVCRTGSIVRRLTLLECERLQGFPDGWTDIGEWIDSKGKKHKDADSPRYKALGNSIALPFWEYLARRICAQYERNITMGSLFDGIGGFPLVFERCGAKAVWASEIEEFPIAVTKRHFPEEDDL